MKPLSLTVAVINWNSGVYLQLLLKSLIPIRRAGAEVIVADNASSDASLAGIEEKPDLRVRRFEQNFGFGGAANRIILHSTRPFLLLLNPDIEIVAESIFRLYERMEEQKEAAIVCGPLTDESGRPRLDFQIRPLPTLRSILSDVLFLDEFFGRPYPGGKIEVPETANQMEVEQPAAAFWLLRREAWESIGGFDEQFYPAWFEDVDFCKRLKANGWKNYLYKDCPVYHHGGLSLQTLGYRKFIRIYHRNLLKYLKKHHHRAYPALWLPVQLGGAARRRLPRKP